MGTYFVGIDVGSSSVKTSIFDVESGASVGRAAYPPEEQTIESPQPGFAEQDPDMWWEHFLKGYRQAVSSNHIDTGKIRGIGIAYQMHGLVLVDSRQQSLRPSIIWCDSRAVDVGATAFEQIGVERCLENMLNSPGNFTASKLGWVKQNEPEVFAATDKFMLPGDYIAMKLTGRVTTTKTGLSEGVFLDFKSRDLSAPVMDAFGFPDSIVPEVVPALGVQGTVSKAVAESLGLREDVRITYRAGDQPNNALSLNVRNPGEVAATAGTSGVIYAVTDQDVFDHQSRINTFLHATDTIENKRNGILICVNGTGILYSWLRRLFSTGGELTYNSLNNLVESAPIGSEELLFYPFGNGAERVLQNRRPNASIHNLDFVRHNASHVARAGIEGIVFALNLGFDLLKELDVRCDTIRAGNANLFLSDTFRDIFAAVTETVVEIYDTDGADGAARASAIGAGYYANADEAFDSLKRVAIVEPSSESIASYQQVFHAWKSGL